ncbi:hypothetical protein EV702DRAFT_966434 [Suillus placidus]|uniref:Reverse transcriptase zinc-binding domain-containing protein n=1 Tax=Suillus placidus TaxID=48579 RepID=A0A9P7A0Q2_9AGAM|nr:hypothetical protein EV702DRAFT_966434 [Suillus placidus]
MEIVAIGALWYGQNDTQNKAFRAPDNLATTEAREWAAILEATRTTPKHAKLELIIKIPKIIKDLTINLPRLEQTGWTAIPNTRLIRAAVAELRERNTTTILKPWGKNLKKQDETDISNLIKQSEDKPNTYNIRTMIKNQFNTSGIAISKGSQCLFYRGIREINSEYHKRRQTKMALAMTHHVTREISLGMPTKAQIWKSIRNKDIPKGIRGFLWKNLHGAYRLGDFWLNIPHFEHRSTCKLCGSIESMEHILVECKDSLARTTIWKLAEKLWCMHENDWPDIKYGTILGCYLAHFMDTKKERLEGKSRLFSILISESAHMIWKLRCEQVIKFNDEGDKLHSEMEIHNQWVATINKRLKFDRLLTDASRYGKHVLRENLVLRTWSGVLMDEDNRPNNWVQQAGVLVGIMVWQPPGRSR